MLTVIRQWLERATLPVVPSISVRSVARILPEYSPIGALSAMARFPWLVVASNAVASDLAATPIVAVRTDLRRKTGQRKIEPASRAVALLDAPSPGMTRGQLLGQIGIDRYLTGNGYLWVPGLGAWSMNPKGSPYPTLALRCHPQGVTVAPLGLSRIGEYAYQDTSGPAPQLYRIPPEDMIHFRGPSWRDTGLAVLGESLVRSLDDDLRTSIASRELAAQQAASGRPDVIFSVQAAIDAKASAAILDRYAVATGPGGVGALVVGNGVEATPVSWAPKDFPFAEREDQLRDTILALFEVTPARAGVASANYGTDRQQARTYWTSIVRRSVEWAEGLSRLCEPGLHLEYDFSGNEALQVSYSERMARVQAWVGMGVPLADAAAYEGFDEAPKATQAAKPTESVAPETDSEDGYQGDRG
jgi:phage portal protein BeeE